MKIHITKTLSLLSLVVALLVSASPATAADTYEIDGAHSSFSFAVKHAGISWVHGRFNKFRGTVTLDEADLSKSVFEVSLPVDSIDTNQAKRDEHLRSPDFFNEKQFPFVTFKSTKVEDKGENLHVTGNFTMHGVTKSITLDLNKGGSAELPKGVHRVGFSTEAVIKRSEYGMDYGIPMVGDEVKISISFEAVKQ